jgi:hypothetical protein
VAGASKLDLIELASRCVSIWDAFLGKTICPAIPRVFDPRGLGVLGARRCRFSARELARPPIDYQATPSFFDAAH